MKITDRNASRREYLYPRWLALVIAALVALAGMVAGPLEAAAETRTLKLYFIHTKEKAEITFKRNGRYDQAGLAKVNRFLRDWRRNEPTKMDPRLLDLVWETYRAVGARDYINVVSAYRSPATNSMLRTRSKGVAKKSQHMLGKAMDFFIPGVSLAKLRATGMKMQVGGVGYYPRSGSPFVHLDVGNVRHWPKMSRRELVSLFPNGKTLHVPSDGKPLPGFDQAMASYQARKKNGSTALALAGSSSKPTKGLLAALFGGGADEEEESGGLAEIEAAPPARKIEKPQPQAPREVAKPAEPLPGIRVVPPEQANRVDVPMVAEAEEPRDKAPEQIIASLSPRAVPLPLLAPRPKVDVGEAEMATASVGPMAPPADIPFGTAQDVPADSPLAAEAGESEVALNVPVPTPRPGSVDTAAVGGLALALAPTDPGVATDVPFPLPSLRPGDDDAIAALSALPEDSEIGDQGSRDAAVEATVRDNEARVAALSSAMSEAEAPIAIPVPAPRTTEKASRATRRDARPDRKAVVRAAEPKAALWVLNRDYVSSATQNTTAPSFAYNAVVTAPREVYTTGFQKGEQAAANRFTGKAVTFISVARFQ